MPCKATFSTKLAALAKFGIVETTFDALVKKAHKGTVVYHVNRDSTAIEAREIVKKSPVQKAVEQPKERGKPAKSEGEPTVLEKQWTQDAQTALSELNQKRAWVREKNSQGRLRDRSKCP